MKGMKGKKRKWMSLLSLLLCVLMAVPASSVAAEESEGSDEGVLSDVDNTSWMNAPWHIDEKCEKTGGDHVFYTESDRIIPGPFGQLFRANYTYDDDLEATCEYGDGRIVLKYCKNCKTWVVVGTTVKPKCEEHQWSNTVTEEADCTKAGRTYKKCAECGILGELKEFPKKEHIPGEWVVVKEPSCSVSGSGILGEEMPKCTECGSLIEEQSRPIQPTHKFGEGKVTKEPQIGVPGVKEFVCEKCGYKKTESIPALTLENHEHKFAAHPTDCEKEQCYLCGETRPSNKKHTVEKWAAITNGEHRGKCEVCGKYVTEEHQYEDDNNCTTDVNCTVCGLQIQKGYSEHNKYPQISGGSSKWIYMIMDDGTHARKCTNDGCEQTTGVDRHMAGDRKGSCNLCGAAPETDDTTEGEKPGDPSSEDTNLKDDKKTETPDVTTPEDTEPKEDQKEDQNAETPGVTTPEDTIPKGDLEDSKGTEDPGTDSPSNAPENPGTETEPQAPVFETVVELPILR